MPKRKSKLTINQAVQTNSEETTLLLDVEESSEEDLQNPAESQVLSEAPQRSQTQLSDLPNDVWGNIFKILYRAYEREARDSVLSALSGTELSDDSKEAIVTQKIPDIQDQVFKDFFSDILNLRTVNKTWNQNILNQADFKELSSLLAQYSRDAMGISRYRSTYNYKQLCVTIPSAFLCASSLLLAVTLGAGLGIQFASPGNTTDAGGSGGILIKRDIDFSDMPNSTQFNSTHTNVLSSPFFVASFAIEGGLFSASALWKLTSVLLDRASQKATEYASKEKQTMKDRFAAYGLFADKVLPKVEPVLEGEKNSLTR